ncbi:MAG: type II secretion system protein M [Pseudomonadales bacterium]|nr:type II secretion system protein M [Pseudomonadales bacterium]
MFASLLQSNPRYQQLAQQYQNLESRERIAVLCLAGFMFLLLVYALVWSPANNFYADSKLNHERQLEIIQYLRSTEDKARAVSQLSTTTSAAQPLLQTISSLAGNAGIRPDRIQPEGAVGVSVWFDDVAFDGLVAWLEVLNQQGIIIGQIAIDREEAPGLVNARIIFHN